MSVHPRNAAPRKMFFAVTMPWYARSGAVVPQKQKASPVRKGLRFGWLRLAEFGAEAVCHVGVGGYHALAMHDCGFELHIGGGFCFFVEEVESAVVVLLHDVDVFLVEVPAGEAIELVILGLVVGVEAVGPGESPGVGEGLHAHG